MSKEPGSLEEKLKAWQEGIGSVSQNKTLDLEENKQSRVKEERKPHGGRRGFYSQIKKLAEG